MNILIRSMSSRAMRSEEHTSELQSLTNLVCRLLLEKKKNYLHMGAGHRPLARCPHKPTRALCAGSVVLCGGNSRQPQAGYLGLFRGFFFFFNDTGPPEIYPLPPPAALPI